MKKLSVLLLLFAALFGACGGAKTGPESSYCKTVDKFAKAIKNQNTSDPKKMKDLVETWTKYLNEMKETAPEKIKKDTATLADAFATISKVFADAGYDQTKIKPQDLQKVQKDVEKLTKAQQSVFTYAEKECKIKGLKPDVSGGGGDTPTTKKGD